ncbi:hypothetical protein [Mesorhizobium sp. M7A.F.Ca.ET.027.02.1.1]|uniref:hypothetical protein n=1 Tax=Mesorhizobium sp. M7A.F.Ca.ET.027.02.1.1 TaxID=2496655 RepID=UPI002479AC8B|nr:hypothetical protein [Mesorhizobium sp. M7A.F.Ca.ET.027.02.1.1]
MDAWKIEMGHGDRALVPGGRLHPTYRAKLPPISCRRRPTMAREQYMRQVQLLVRMPGSWSTSIISGA